MKLTTDLVGLNLTLTVKTLAPCLNCQLALLWQLLASIRRFASAMIIIELSRYATGDDRVRRRGRASSRHIADGGKRIVRVVRELDLATAGIRTGRTSCTPR